VSWLHGWRKSARRTDQWMHAAAGPRWPCRLSMVSRWWHVMRATLACCQSSICRPSPIYSAIEGASERISKEVFLFFWSPRALDWGENILVTPAIQGPYKWYPTKLNNSPPQFQCPLQCQLKHYTLKQSAVWINYLESSISYYWHSASLYIMQSIWCTGIAKLLHELQPFKVH